MAAQVIDMKSKRRQLPADVRYRMRRFVNGEITWAQVEGMTFEQAQRIAKVGCELAGRGRLEDARVIFEGLVAGNPKDTASQVALGAIYQRLNRKADAMACYDKALRLFDRNVVALANRGELRIKSNDAGGIDDLTRAVEIDPKGLTAASRRARALLSFIVKRAQARSATRRVATR
jgi:tetratricopeptide (TPR) repeat protein